MLGIALQHLDRGQGGAVQLDRPAILHPAHDQIGRQDRIGLAGKSRTRVGIETAQEPQHFRHPFGAGLAQPRKPLDIARAQQRKIVEQNGEIGCQHAAITGLQPQAIAEVPGKKPRRFDLLQLGQHRFHPVAFDQSEGRDFFD